MERSPTDSGGLFQDRIFACDSAAALMWLGGEGGGSNCWGRQADGGFGEGPVGVGEEFPLRGSLA